MLADEFILLPIIAWKRYRAPGVPTWGKEAKGWLCNHYRHLSDIKGPVQDIPSPDARVTLEHDKTRVPEKQFACSMRLAVRGPDLFAKDVESDLYAAIDCVTKKIEQQIRKRHGKFKVIKHKDAAKVKALRRSANEE